MGCASSVEERRNSSETKLSETQKQEILLQIFNLYNEELFKGNSKGLLSIESAKRIIYHRVQNGGVFWNFNDIQKSFDTDELLKKYNSKELFESLLQDCQIPTEVESIVDGPKVLETMLQCIHNAKQYIHLSIMLFFNDSQAFKIINALSEKAKSGVEVRVFADGLISTIGSEVRLIREPSRGDFQAIAERLRSSGAKVVSSSNESFNDKLWVKSKRKELKEKGIPEYLLQVQDYIQRNIRLNLNVVYHRKFMIIDGKESWIGSVNIGDEYIYDTPLTIDSISNTSIPSKSTEWHDGLLHVLGNSVAQHLNVIFASQWMILGGDIYDFLGEKYNPQQDGIAGNDDCALMFNFPGNPVNVLQEFYFNLLRFSKGPVILENPYLVDKKLYETLESLNEEQCKRITIITCVEENDVTAAKTSVKCFMLDPVKKGMQVFDYSAKHKRFSHWKSAVDLSSGIAMNGSYNLNTRSALHDFEANLLVRSPTVLKQMNDQLQSDLRVSHKILESDLHGPPHVRPSCLITNLLEFVS